MTEQEFDRTLRRALLDAVAQDEKAALKPDSLPPVSAQHARSMQKMLRDPLRWARARRRPSWQRPLQAAAMVAIVGFLTLGALRIAPDVGAFIRRYFVTDREQDVLYEFVGEQLDREMPVYYPTALPEGYTLDKDASMHWESSDFYVFYNESGRPLYFDCVYMHQGTALTVSKEDMEISEVTINGCAGTLYLSQKPEEKSSTLVWLDEEANIRFTLDGYLDKETLIRIALSVEKLK